MTYFLYILKSQTADKHYIGISKNPERRLQYHNTLENGFTSRYRPWKIVFKKEFETKQEAMMMEKNLRIGKVRL